MLNKRYLFPLKIGVTIGLIIGICQANPIIRYFDYLRYHLYNTTAGIVSLEVDRWVLIIAAAAYAAWLIYLAGNKLKGKVRIAYWLIVVCAVAAYRFRGLGTDDILFRLRDINLTFFTAAYQESKWQIIGAGLLFLSMVVYLVRKRGRAVKQVRRTVLSPSVDLFAGTRSFIRIIERQTWFFATVFVLFVGLNLAAGLLWAGTRVTSKSKPNVIIIMVDTLRADHVGCYGYSRNTTPNIDRFAEKSIRFERVIANSSWTTASVSSFMSSQLPQTTLAVAHGGNIYQSIPADKDAGISPRCITIAEKLNDLGYVTAGITSNPQYSIERNGEQGFDFFDESTANKETSSPGVLSVARKLIAKYQNKRFFLFALLMDTHSPYRRHPGFDFAPGYKGKDADKVIIGGPAKNDSTVSHMLDLYDSGVAYTDHHVGLLLDELKKRGLYDKSLIVFIADHGEEFREHGKLFHGSSLYHELVSVPLMIKLPYQTQGRVVTGTFSLIDLFPTILGALGSDPATIHPQGKTVDLRKVRELRDQYIFGQTNLEEADLRSVQNRRYMYVHDMKTSTGKLFDLVKDPVEKHNVAPQDSKLAGELKKMILAKEDEVRPDESITEITPMKRAAVRANDKARADRMRSLGYLQ